MAAAISLDTLPPRISPGLAYFAHKNRSQSKGKQRAETQDEKIEAGDGGGLLKKLQEIQAKKHGSLQNHAPQSPRRVVYCDRTESNTTYEELVWQASTLVWSRNSAVYRMYTFEEEAHNDQSIQEAVFAWFPVPAPPPPTLEPSSIPSSALLPSGSLLHSPPPLSRSSSASLSSIDDGLYGPFADPRPPPWSDDNRSSLSSTTLSKTHTSTSLVRVLCVRFKEQLYLYLPDGSHHILHLRFPVRKIWPLERGLLLERQYVPNLWDNVPVWLRAGRPVPVAQSINELESSFYSLLDPFADFLPTSKVPELHFRTPLANARNATSRATAVSASTSGTSSPIIDSEERILFASSPQKGEDPLFVSANVRSGKMSVWTYAHIPEDTEELLNKGRHRQLQLLESMMRDDATMLEDTALTGRAMPAADRVAHLTGKRRRSIDIAVGRSRHSSNGQAVSSSGQPRISTASLLLDRRKSNALPSSSSGVPLVPNNANNSVAGFLESMGTVPATGFPQSSSNVALVAATRRTSTAGSAMSAAPFMDRRTSTTRNELSVSLDRMALSSGVGTFHPNAALLANISPAVATAVNGDADPHHVPGDMERETMLLPEESRCEEPSEVFMSRLFSTNANGLTCVYLLA